jgi:hypothetical protein
MLPDAPPPIVMSAFGPKAVTLAARIADGYFGAWPARDLIRRYRELGGTGPAMGELKVCWHADEEEGVRIAHRTWRHELISGQHSQDLPNRRPASRSHPARPPRVAGLHHPRRCSRESRYGIATHPMSSPRGFLGGRPLASCLSPSSEMTPRRRFGILT